MNHMDFIFFYEEFTDKVNAIVLKCAEAKKCFMARQNYRKPTAIFSLTTGTTDFTPHPLANSLLVTQSKRAVLALYILHHF